MVVERMCLSIFTMLLCLQCKYVSAHACLCVCLCESALQACIPDCNLSLSKPIKSALRGQLNFIAVLFLVFFFFMKLKQMLATS